MILPVLSEVIKDNSMNYFRKEGNLLQGRKTDSSSAEVRCEYVMFSLHFDDISMTLNGFSAFSTILSFPFGIGSPGLGGEMHTILYVYLFSCKFPAFLLLLTVKSGGYKHFYTKVTITLT